MSNDVCLFSELFRISIPIALKSIIDFQLTKVKEQEIM